MQSRFLISSVIAIVLLVSAVPATADPVDDAGQFLCNHRVTGPIFDCGDDGLDATKPLHGQLCDVEDPEDPTDGSCEGGRYDPPPADPYGKANETACGAEDPEDPQDGTCDGGAYYPPGPPSDPEAFVHGRLCATEDPTDPKDGSCSGGRYSPPAGPAQQVLDDAFCGPAGKEDPDEPLDGRCTDEGTYVPPGLANLTGRLEETAGPLPIVCGETSDPDDLVMAAVNNPDCDARSTADESNELAADPTGFLTAPRCNNPLIYENETTDCSEVADPEELVPEDPPYGCLADEKEPVKLIDGILNNPDCDDRSTADEINGILADPQGFLADPEKNNPLLPG